MKKNKRAAVCTVGAILMGFFAGQLNTVIGSMMFVLGIALVGGALMLYPRKKKDEEEQE